MPRFKVGELVDYQGIQAEIINIGVYQGMSIPVYYYDIDIQTGSPVCVDEGLLSPILTLPHGNNIAHEYAYDIVKESPGGKPKPKSNGCECGAWATSFPEDHMTYCPVYK